MAKDLEARVAALEKAVAKGLYGGEEEDALKKWDEQFHSPPPIQGPKGVEQGTLHPTAKKGKV